MKLFRSPSSKHVHHDSSSSQAEPSNNNSKDSPRRRNFRFLRSVDQKRRTSVATQKKTRAHARELAMAYNDPPSDTPTSTTSSNVNLLSRQDVSTPSPTKRKENNFFDPFGNNPAPKDPFVVSQKAQGSSLLDEHFASGFSDVNSKEPTASTIDSFDTSSMGSELDLFHQGSSKPARLDEFMGRQQQRERNVIAMPNSTTTSANNSNSVNALARRRIRNQPSVRQSSDMSVGSNYSEGSQFSETPESPGSLKGFVNKNRRSQKPGSSAGSVTGSVYSQTSATYASTASEQNLWDTERQDGGFTFDAFGLDASKVEQDVNDAMQELVTEGMRGFSFFQQDSDQESEFASQNWDSPNTSHMSLMDEEEDYRVQQQPPSRRGRSPPPPRGKTPPRWEKPKQQQQHAKGGFAEFENPWKEDLWGSGSEPDYANAASEVGASSEFGGTKSEFLPAASSSSVGFKSPFSGNKSDHGGVQNGYLAKLASPNVTHKRPVKLNHNDYDDEVDSEDGMQDELAREFAQEFVKRISPRSATASPSSQSLGSRSYGDYSEKSEIDSDYSGHPDYDQETSTTPKSISDSLTPKSKFRNFRERYELTKSDQPATPVQSYRARAAQKDEEDIVAASPAGEAARRSSHSSLRSSYNAAKATTRASTGAPSTLQYGRPSEEKKEDEETTSSQAGLPKRGTLKAKWQKFESKSKPSVTVSPVGRKSPVPKQQVVVDDTDAQSIEILSSESADGRSSPGPGRFGRASDINKSAFSRLREESTPKAETPSFANVTLRRTLSKSKMTDLVDGDDVDSPSPRSARPVSYRQQQSPVEQSYSDERPQTPTAEFQGEPVERKLTYRERREQELKRDAAEKAKSPQKTDTTPKKDVAALIRRRIAANKQKSTDQTNESADEVSNFRNRLKPVNSRPTSPQGPEDQATSAPSPSVDVPTPLSAGKFRYSTESEKDLPTRPSSSGPVVGSPLNDYIQQNKSQNKGSLLDHETVVSLQAENADLQAKLKALENQLAAKETAPAPTVDTSSAEDHHKMLGGMLAKRLSPTAKAGGTSQDSKSMLDSMLAARGAPAGSRSDAPQDPKKMLGNMLSARGAPPMAKEEVAAPSVGGRPALKDDPKYEKYFKMMKVGMPKDVVKHAMQRDGLDPDLLDANPNQPAGLPLKEDPKYGKYFKMLKIGIPMGQVKHALERDGLNPAVMDQDHSLPAAAAEKLLKKKEPKIKDTHRRARLHWKTMKKVVRNSIWGKIETDESMSCIDIDEDEFQNLFQAELGKTPDTPKNGGNGKKGPSVRVIDNKRANNGGIILARIKMSHDEMADAVDRMDSDCFNARQIENIIEYLPTKEEREKLEKYMIEGGLDAAEKFNGLCECEKFMVSMMTVKHAKRKVNALLFKLQFDNCLASIAADADMIDQACDELKKSERLRHLLGIVLQFGNRLNTAGSGEKNKAGSFTLDSLLKLNQAKAFDKKTTFLNYIVLIVQRNNERLLGFADDIQTVGKAERVYWDQCVSDLEDVENQLENVRRISLHVAKSKTTYRLKKKKDRGDDDDSINDDHGMSLEEEVGALRSTQTGLFTLSAIKQVSALRDKVDATMVKFEKLLEYFGEDESGSKQPHELFAIFSKFSGDFSKAKEEVFRKQKKMQRDERKKQRDVEKKQGKPPTQPGSQSFSSNKDGKNGFSGPRSSTNEGGKTWPKVSTSLSRGESVSGATSATADSQDDSSYTESDPKTSAKASFRDQARHRRLRQVHAGGRAPVGTPPKPVPSNSSMNRTSVKYPSVNNSPAQSLPPANGLRSTAGTPPPKPPTSSSTTPTGSRNLMRNRRRLLEERKKRSTPTDNSSPWHASQTAS